MYINPIVLGVCCTVGVECLLTVIVLTVSALRYVRKNGLSLPIFLRLVQSWVNSKEQQ